MRPFGFREAAGILKASHALLPSSSAKADDPVFQGVYLNTDAAAYWIPRFRGG
jgi:hypothetical protein